MLTGNCILRINSVVSLTMDASWSKTSSNPVNVAQGGFGTIDITAGKGKTHQFQVSFWAQLNGFEYDFSRLEDEKFDLEFIIGETAFGGQRERYGPCLFSNGTLTVDNANGIVKLQGTIIAARRKK